MCFGKGDSEKLKNSFAASFIFIAAVTVIMNIIIFALADPILHLLNVPDEIYEMMRSYVVIVFGGLFFVFLYNYFAFLLRAIGNSAFMPPIWG